MSLGTLTDYDVKASCNCRVVKCRHPIYSYPKIVIITVEHYVTCKYYRKCKCQTIVWISDAELTFDGDIQYFRHRITCLKKKRD